MTPWLHRGLLLVATAICATVVGCGHGDPRPAAATSALLPVAAGPAATAVASARATP